MKDTIMLDETIYIREDLIKDGTSYKSSCIKIGKKYYIRTVTHHYIGEVVSIDDYNRLVLKDASWIADSGRWADALAKGELNEVEPYPGETIVNLDALCDMSEWNHDLPRDQI